MKIKCLTTFLDGRDRFEQDDERTVSAEDGARFIANGWAVESGQDAPAAAAGATTTDLVGHDSIIKTEATRG